MSSAAQPIHRVSNVRGSRRGVGRPRALPVRGWSRDERESAAEIIAQHERPRTRGDCLTGCNSQRPCPWVSCRYHLYLDVTSGGFVRPRFQHCGPGDLRETCALDVADRGGVTLEEIGALLNFTRERVRQVELGALEKLRAAVDPEIESYAAVLERHQHEGWPSTPSAHGGIQQAVLEWRRPRGERGQNDGRARRRSLIHEAIVSHLARRAESGDEYAARRLHRILVEDRGESRRIDNSVMCSIDFTAASQASDAWHNRHIDEREELDRIVEEYRRREL